MGDTYAKYFEAEMSSKGEELQHYFQMGVNASRMCYEPIMKYGKAAMDQMTENKILMNTSSCIGDYSINCCCFNLSYGRAHSSLQFRIGTCYILFFDSASAY